MSHMLQQRVQAHPSPLPEHNWQKIATDLFEWRKVDYLLVVVAKLTSTLNIVWIPEHDSEGTVVEEINPTLYVCIYIVQTRMELSEEIVTT